MCTFNVVAEWEERIRTKSYTLLCIQPSTFFFACQDFWLFSKEVLPYTISQYILIVFTDVDIDCIITVCTTDLFYPWQVQYLRMLTQIPDISFVTSQTSTVDTTLLTSTDTDSLTIFYVTYRVRLSILQRNQCNHQVTFCSFCKFFILCWDIFKQIITVQFDFVTALFESYTKYLFAFNWSWYVVRINLDYIVSSFTFVFQDSECFFSESRSNDTIRDFTIDETSCSFVTYIAQCDEVAIRRHTVGSTSTYVCISQR